jgi:hypothetical protein
MPVTCDCPSAGTCRCFNRLLFPSKAYAFTHRLPAALPRPCHHRPGSPHHHRTLLLHPQRRRTLSRATSLASAGRLQGPSRQASTAISPRLTTRCWSVHAMLLHHTPTHIPLAFLTPLAQSRAESKRHNAVSLRLLLDPKPRQRPQSGEFRL